MCLEDFNQSGAYGPSRCSIRHREMRSHMGCKADCKDALFWVEIIEVYFANP